MSEYKFIVEELKIRLDKFLADLNKDISRSHIQRDIAAGQVLVNGQKVLESKFVVRKGDKVQYQVVSSKHQGEDIKPTNTSLKVLYNNHGLLIIDKPAGLVVHPGAGFKGETLASGLLYQFKDIKLVGEEGRPGIVHRLDKDTSGVMLVAKSQEMYEYLKDAFAEKKVKKEYLALACGRVEKPHGVIEAPIGKSKKDFRKYDTKNIIQAKDALTEYWVLEQLSSGVDPQASLGIAVPVFRNLDTYTLLRVKLHTGRTHQIRVHFNSIGHPLAGDKLYGGKRAYLDGLSRQFLHAKQIEVRLPDGTWIEAESELPQDLRKVLENLESRMVNQL